MAGRVAYHHGDLRRALIEAGLAILEGEGLEALTLRATAARAGVSHAAPAHHFGNLRGLLTALATVGFERFAAAMRSARAAAPADPASQLRAAERGYLDFARANPALFRMMFHAGRLDWSDGLLNEVGFAARRELTEVAAPAAARLGWSPSEVERMIWSHIHGFAHLSIDRKIGDPVAAPPDLAALLFRD